MRTKNQSFSSATVVGTDTVSSEEQVQCLIEWALGGGDDTGRVVTIDGAKLTVSATSQSAIAYHYSCDANIITQIINGGEPVIAEPTGASTGIGSWVWAVVVVAIVAVAILTLVIVILALKM